MSKLVELIRPEQAIKGFDKKNLSKSSLDALNKIEREYITYKYSDMITFQDASTLIVAGYGNFMSEKDRFIIPEIFPAKAETDKVGFQRFALPMIRNINGVEAYPNFYIADFQEIKYNMEIISARNYVAYEFYPYDIPILKAIDDTQLQGVLIAIDVGAATKVRFWRTGGKVINYNTTYSLATNLYYHENPYPLFEYDVVPYSRNYIYLYVKTTCFDYINNSYPLFNTALFADGISNIANNVYSPKIKMELFSEDYSAQRFESGINAGKVVINNTHNLPIFNVSNELCVAVKTNGNSTGNNNLTFEIYEPLYSESTIPNTLNNKSYVIIEPVANSSINKLKLPIKSTSIKVSGLPLNVNAYLTLEPR